MHWEADEEGSGAAQSVTQMQHSTPYSTNDIVKCSSNSCIAKRELISETTATFLKFLSEQCLFAILLFLV